MKKYFSAFVAVLMMAAMAAPAFAEQGVLKAPAFAKDGKFYVHSSIVNTIPGKDGSPVYITYGEDERKGGYRGNGWLMGGVKVNLKDYVMAVEGDYYTYVVPNDVRQQTDKIRFNVCQNPGKSARWADIKKFQEQLTEYVERKATPEEKADYMMAPNWNHINGIVLPTK